METSEQCFLNNIQSTFNLKRSTTGNSHGCAMPRKPYSRERGKTSFQVCFTYQSLFKHEQNISYKKNLKLTKTHYNQI